MKTIRVQTRQPYDVLVGRGILPVLGERLAGRPGGRPQKALVVCDDRVGRLYGEAVREAVARQGMETAVFRHPPGEESKTVETASRLLEWMAVQRRSGTDVVVALGGGATMDLAGFAAGLFRGGMDYVQAPTTLCAAIDSSVSEGCELHLAAGRNLARVRHLPSLVLCDVSALDTLEGDAFTDGLAGAVALACVGDGELFRLLETASPRSEAVEVVARSVEQKSRVAVEPGLRELLTFGRTMGGGVERLSGHTLSRGKTRAVGMCLVADACVKNGLMKAAEAARLRALLARLGLPTGCRYALADVCRESLALLEEDPVHLVTLERIGKGAVYPMTPARLTEFFTG